MILGTGLDLLETARLARILEKHGRRFEDKVFTALELEHCRGRQDRVLALAARFAAKEACLKALGTGWSAGLALRQIELYTKESGKPELRLHGAADRLARRLGVTAIHVSLTHQPTLAAAMVILEG